MNNPWTIDSAHTNLTFSVRHMGLSTVRGQFREVTATCSTTDDGALASVSAEITVSSLDTRVTARDDHLRSSDFFDVERFPTATFRSSAIHAHGEELTVDGTLELRGVSKPLSLTARVHGPIVDPWGKRRLAIEASGTIDRRDFDLTWNQTLETGGLLVSHRVQLQIEGQAVAVDS